MKQRLRDMMRLVLLLLLLASFPLPLSAQTVGGGVWRAKTVHVYDYTSPRWAGIFPQAVADANALLPKRAPRIEYHRMPEMDCAIAPMKRRAIVICEGSPDLWPPFLRTHAGMTFSDRERHTMRWARVQLNAERPAPESARTALACHELIGHAILGLIDDYNSKTPAESCLYASAERPGTWDAAFARWLYKKFARKH